jgi:ankyrin repeat protein
MSERLINAVKKGAIVRSAELIAEGDSATYQDFECETPLHYAVMGGHLAVAELLLQSGALINAQNNYGQTPLLKAIYAEDLDMIVALLSWDADPNIESIHPPDSPLREAARRGLFEAINYLILAGADIDKQHELSAAPVVQAALEGKDQAVYALIEAGASLEPLRIAAAEADKRRLR